LGQIFAKNTSRHHRIIVIPDINPA
jgi:hypothetical protein